jgi:hypothetical protein
VFRTSGIIVVRSGRPVGQTLRWHGLNDRPRIGYSHVQTALAFVWFAAVGPTGVVI